jgi:hypothetical protein
MGATVEVEAADRRIAAFRQVELTDRLLDLGQRLLEVGAEIELGEDERQRAARGRLHGLQPRDVADGLLDGLGDLDRDIFGAGSGHGRDDGHEGELDVGQKLLAQ